MNGYGTPYKCLRCGGTWEHKDATTRIVPKQGPHTGRSVEILDAKNTICPHCAYDEFTVIGWDEFDRLNR